MTTEGKEFFRLIIAIFGISLTIVVFIIMAIDYFHDGCSADDRYLVSEQHGSRTVYVHPTRCQQIFIHTASGRAREKQNIPD